MVNTAIAIKKFPKLSETFIVRQAAYLDAYVFPIFDDLEARQAFDYPYANKVNALYSNQSKVKELYGKISNKIQGIPFRVWTKTEKENFEKLLEANNIEVVFAPFGPSAINALASCKEKNIPLLIQFLGYDANALLRYKWYEQKIMEALDYASAAIFLHSAMADPFIKMGMNPEKIHVIHLGVPVDEFTFSLLSDEPLFRFLAVGRFVEKKSPLTTIKAFLKCADELEHVRLTMVGDGPLHDEAVQIVETSKHKHKVELTGALIQSELKPIFRQSHCFLQHSVTASNGDQEGWPVSIAEACATGLPVISTRHAGIPTQVIEGKNGFLVEENDEQGMAEAMIRLAQNRKLCQKMGKAAREHISIHGNQDIELEKIKQLIIDCRQ